MKNAAPERSARTGAPVVGILGAVASGKSTVAHMMAEEGALLVEADRIAHEVLQRSDVKRRLREAFGNGIFAPDGSVNRAELGRIVFSEGGDGARQKLNALVHPFILADLEVQEREARRRAAKAGTFVVLDAPLLLEKHLEGRCDVLVFVDAPEAERQARALEQHGWNAEELHQRDAAQAPASEKRQKAQIVIENAGDKVELRNSVRKLMDQIKSDLKR